MQNAKDRSLFIATFGTASPPMAAGAMLLLYQFAMALFIGLVPLIILCLIFDRLLKSKTLEALSRAPRHFNRNGRPNPLQLRATKV